MSRCSPYGKLPDNEHLQGKAINQQLAEAQEQNLGIVLTPILHVRDIEK